MSTPVGPEYGNLRSAGCPTVVQAAKWSYLSRYTLGAVRALTSVCFPSTVAPFLRSCVVKLYPFFQAAVAIAIFVVTFPAYGAELAVPPHTKPAVRAKSVTVFPVVLTAGQPLPASLTKTSTELIGVFLERAGMQQIEIADTQFSPPADSDLDKAAAAFSQFVQSRKRATQFALFGQLIGSPGSGVDEIRLVVANRQGQIVLAQRLDRKEISPGGKKVELMEACLFLVNHLREPWGLADPMRKDAPEGKMSALLNKNSGIPPKDELDAMQPRRSALKKNIHSSTVAVYPVGVSGKSDEAAGLRLTQMLTKEGIGRAQSAGIDPKLDIPANTNQTKILWDIARAFQDFLRKNPPTADYALFADYGISRTPDGKTGVGGVQFVLCDRSGNWVLVDLQNSHHADFQRIDPQSVDDCNRLVVERLKVTAK
jgi:hypothetical protein